MRVGFAKVTKLTDFWGRIITLVTGGAYKHTEIVFSAETTQWYIEYLIRSRRDFYEVWIQESWDQLRSARENANLPPYPIHISELPLHTNLRLCFSSSAMDRGIRFKLIDLEPKKWDFISCDGSQEMEEEVIEWCEIQVGRRYDFLGLAGFILCHLKLVKPDKKKAWCSEITEDVLYQTYHLHGPRTTYKECSKKKRTWYRPPSPVALWKRLSKLPQPVERLVWTK